MLFSLGETSCLFLKPVAAAPCFSWSVGELEEASTTEAIDLLVQGRCGGVLLMVTAGKSWSQCCDAAPPEIGGLSTLAAFQ
jgi:hypothetical protein